MKNIRGQSLTEFTMFLVMVMLIALALFALLNGVDAHGSRLIDLTSMNLP